MKDQTLIIKPDPIDPAWALPTLGEDRGTVTAECFARLLAAARTHGWPAVWRVFAEGRTTTEPTPSTGEPRLRPARRKTLREFFAKRPDLHALIEDAANQHRDRLLNQLEDEAAKIALGPGDTSTDFDKTGRVTRVRTDVRNKLRAIETLLKAHDPDTYGDKKKVEVAGQLNHAHLHAQLPDADTSGYRVDFDSLEQALSLDERREFIAMLDRIEAVRIERQRERIAEQNHHRPALPGQVVSGETDHE